MPGPLAIYVERIRDDDQPGDMFRCVVLERGQPGLGLSPDCDLIWQPVEPPSVLLISAGNEQLAIHRALGAPQVMINRGGRELKVLFDTQTIVMSDYEIEISGQRLRVHVHGSTPEPQPPRPLDNTPSQIPAPLIPGPALGPSITSSGQGSTKLDLPPPPPIFTPPPTIDAPATEISPMAHVPAPVPTPVPTPVPSPIPEIVVDSRIVTSEIELELDESIAEDESSDEPLEIDMSPTPLTSFKLPSPGRCAVWSSVKPTLAVGCEDGTLLLVNWSVETSTLEAAVSVTLEHLAPMVEIQWCTNGFFLNVRSESGEEQVLSLGDDGELPEGITWVHPSYISPEGRFRVEVSESSLRIFFEE